MKTCVKCGSTDFNSSGKCRPCVSEYNKAYSIKNKERLKAFHRDWYSAHRHEIAEHNAKNREEKARYNYEYHAKNKDAINAARAERYRKHAEREATVRLAWRERNRDMLREANKLWYANNPDAARVKNNNRRDLAAGQRLTKGICERLYKLQKGRCACCGEPLGDDYHLDHIMPLALGGANTDDNIQLLRAECNQQKHAKHPIDFMQSKGFLL